jgi:hypothetical protein
MLWNLLALRLGTGYVIRWEPSLIFEVWNELSKAPWRNDTERVVNLQIQCSAEQFAIVLLKPRDP